jgi:hypothetical protein
MPQSSHITLTREEFLLFKTALYLERAHGFLLAMALFGTSMQVRPEPAALARRPARRRAMDQW